MPLSMNCHGTAMAPTAIHKVAMGVAVTASGSKSVPMSVSFGIEDQRDEASRLALARAKALKPIASNHAAVPVTGSRGCHAALIRGPICLLYIGHLPERQRVEAEMTKQFAISECVVQRNGQRAAVERHRIAPRLDTVTKPRGCRR
jgi:hypothetical protein